MDDIKKRINSITDEAEDAFILKEIDEINRFTVSNQLRSGFFGQDASVQTEESDLPNVKLLAANTAELMKEVQVLREDTEKKLKIIHVQYETKLQQEADALYTRMNEKITSLEDCHKEKLSVLRRSYQQQLSDALQVVKSSYKKSNRNLEETDLFSDSTDGRVKELVEELEEKNLKIECMTEQLKKYEIDPEGAADPVKNRLKSENEKLKDKIHSLHVELEEIRQTLESQEQTLAVELAMVKLEAENSKKAVQKLTSEHEQVKMQLSLERENGQKKQLVHERELIQKVKSLPLMKQFKEEMEKELAQVEHSSKYLLLCSAEESKSYRFEMTGGFHAIKDEMFLRQSLQRQEAILHNPSVSFAMDAPCAPLQKSDSNLNRLGSTSVAPLPRIGAGGQQKKNRTIGTMDLTGVTWPDNRKT
ncbi:hypothetical protein IRJ41_009059 [Triplophysa rosa]|uniref:DUF4709 domain-containing protein n=1 Tax=Triplophysa rosa TaxID=992332 RepID=A0A9W7WWE3_TRIRA|nr:hypothetical protein IRJ41_009059 [Triplophysa rosa]